MKKLFLSALTWSLVHQLLASPVNTSALLHIDQFGYRPNDQKIAVISCPQVGYNAPSNFSPGSIYEVRDWNTDALVFSGNISAWNNGTTQTQSGDKAWWFDFSSFTTPGSYYIFDPVNNAGSYRFEIDNCVYKDALEQTLHMFYYQRCGMAKSTPYAQSGWTDAICHAGTQQDLDCRLYNNTNVSTSKDLSGGWHDAGDYNKYVNFTFTTLTDLLMAYRENPNVFTDNTGIPESGNGTPDILDEAKYELNWLLKMQNSNGSVLSIVGVTNNGAGSPPSTDNNARRYGPATTSASFCASALFALGAIQFNSVGQSAYAATLQTAAINAYTWATANPNVTFYNSGVIGAGEQEVGAYDCFSRQFAAAVYLFALTGNSAYKTYADANYTNVHLIQWSYAYPFEQAQQDALLYYASLNNATASVANVIKNTYSNSMSSGNADNLPGFLNQTDAYRAWLADNNYTWNSNQTKSSQGNMFLAMNVYNLNSVNAMNYANAASGFVHYFHGVNPNNKTYLSNMGNYGAENSVPTFYHSWFEDGSTLWDEVGISTYGPAPGYIPGGPNPTYDWDGCCPSGCGSPQNNALCYSISISPPKNQPIQKSYKDFNNGWPIDSWSVTEAGIYTNAAYVRMLSKFCSTNCSLTSGENFSANESVSVYPVPALHSLNISFAGMKGEIFALQLLDVSGKVVMSENFSISSDNRIHVIDMSGLMPGTYFVRISSEKDILVKKITHL
ncbi:MAG TPA: glycoside hydrolase family 9 protein [Bacteroidia bacterium]